MSKTKKFSRPAILNEIFKNNQESHCVIEASAGTGKTFTILQIVIELLLKGVSLENIVVVTFTEKATTELKTRIKDYINKLIDNKGVENINNSGSYWLIGDKEEKYLKLAKRNFSKSQIFTIHGFSHKILNEFNLLTGQLFETNPFSDPFLKKQVVYQSVYQNKDLSKNQLIKSWLDDYSESSLFEKIFISMEKGIEKLGPWDYKPLYDSFRNFINYFSDENNYDNFLLILKNRSEKKGMTFVKLKNFINLLLSIDSKQNEISIVWELLKLRFKQSKSDFTYIPRIEWIISQFSSPQYFPLSDFMNNFLNNVIDKQMWVMRELTPQIHKNWMIRKREAGILDFNDMISIFHEILCKNDETSIILKNKLQQKYSHGIIDEFQDTENSQWEIFKNIFLQNGKLFIIGDPKQAIYGFRGTDLQTYFSSKNLLVQKSGSSPVTLNTNYRSTSKMVNLQNYLFETGKCHRAFFSGNNKYIRVHASNDDPNSETPLKIIKIIDKYQSKSQLFYKSVRNSINQIVKILNRSENDTIFILTNTFKEADIVANELKKLEIPFSFNSRDSIFQSEEAFHIRDIFYSIEFNTKQRALNRILLTPFFFINSTDESKIKENINITEVFITECREFSLEKKFYLIVNKLLNQLQMKLDEGVIDFSNLRINSYKQILNRIIEVCEKESLSISDLNLLLYKITKGDPVTSEKFFKPQILATDDNQIHILTMHKSKGLESDYVFILGELAGKPKYGNLSSFHIKQGIKTKKQYVFHPKNLIERKKIESEIREENERLFYVSITRAKKAVYLPLFLEKSMNKCSSKISGKYSLINGLLLDIFLQSENSDNKDLLEFISPESAQISVKPYGKNTPTIFSFPNIDFATIFPPDRKGNSFYSYSTLTKKPMGKIKIQSSVKLKSQGAEFGSFVHKLMEELDIIDPEAGFQNWFRSTTNQESINRIFNNFYLNKEDLINGAHLCFDGFTSPIKLKELSLSSLLEVKTAEKELEFMFRIKDGELNEIFKNNLHVNFDNKKYIRGYFDLIFTFNNKIWIVDWKTDYLSSYKIKSLKSITDRRYRNQVLLYTLAATKIFGIESEDKYNNRFGGILYIYLRGLKNTGEGILSIKPPFKNLKL